MSNSTYVFDSIPEPTKLGKKDFKEQEPHLRQELVTIQQELRHANVPVMMVFAGVDGAGKHEMINSLNAWMDPRWIVTHAYRSPDDAERQRPPFWRYWRDLPANGQLGLYLSAWYSKPLLDRVHRRISPEQFSLRLDEIAAFERTLCDNGILLLKIWMHLDKDAQQQRLEELARHPETEWRIKPGAWENWGMYARFMKASDKIVRASASGPAPWLLVDGRYEYTRTLEVAYALRDAIRQRLDHPPVQSGKSIRSWNETMKKSRGALAKLKLDKKTERETYKKELKQLQHRLVQLQHRAQVASVSTVLVFEGQDAAGKGGSIRRLVRGLDAQEYQVIPIAAPTDEELAHHYLWRFWRHLPRAGRVTIFDRSWYGRVLVERIEGFAKPAEWQRAYGEINEFEQQLFDHGVVLCKFWLQISKDEQMRRFRQRQRVPYKQWKITEEDWRNRKRWDRYTDAVDDMVALTHNRRAPWVLVEGNDKCYARLKVLRTVCQQLEAALEG